MIGFGFVTGLGIGLGLMEYFKVVIWVIGVIRVIGAIVDVIVIVGVKGLSTYHLEFQPRLFSQHQVSTPDNC